MLKSMRMRIRTGSAVNPTTWGTSSVAGGSPFLGAGSDRRRAGVAFQMAWNAARADSSVLAVVHNQMAALGAVIISTGNELATMNDPAANSGSQRQQHQTVPRLPATHPVFTKCRSAGIVGVDDRSIQGTGQFVANRKISPLRQVGRIQDHARVQV